MAFKAITTASLSLESPEALFRDIRTKKIPGLLSQQADILREYKDKALSAADVALQLPTGSGKTLVGLLIAEWRRKKFNERVVYLCPTNQLVHQVADLARSQYGLKLNVFVGKKSEYSPSAKSEYISGETLAVTSYSSLFNTAPFFENPHVIILDDAHSGENYIPKMWSLRIRRSDEPQIFESIMSVITDLLSPVDQHRIRGGKINSWDQTWVEKIPTPRIYDRIPELVSLLDTKLTQATSEAAYAWKMLRERVAACHLYLSNRELLLRPIIPPTFSHSPFSGATQRVYMSATLGEGGDLERITGRQKILRIQLKGWEKQGIGRRFFLFPERSLAKSEVDGLIKHCMTEAGRSLVIVPDDEKAELYRDWVKSNLHFATFTAKDIEVSKAPFTTAKEAVSVLANRYDGIDFPGDQCRTLVVSGMPRATNLQEKFFISRLGAIAMLNDRILTRMVQAFGRCTRSATDFAAIIIEGEELTNYLLEMDRRSFLHPEIQAELQFGIDQSKDQKVADFFENYKAFLQQSVEWQAADAQIVQLRDGLSRKQLPGTFDLNEAADHEVEYQIKLWQEDYVGAYEASRSVLAKLNDPFLRGYRALWSYLAGSAAWLAFKNGLQNFDQQARMQFEAAKKAAPAVPWLAALTRANDTEQFKPTRDEALAKQVENLETILEDLGTAHNRKFDEEECFILENIIKDESEKFEPAHERLGNLLGFRSGKEESNGSPDPWWIIQDDVWVVFDDHSNAKPSSRLDVTKARQVSSHPNWIRSKFEDAKNAKIYPVLVTPVTSADEEAMPHLSDVSVWNLTEFRQWAKEALQVVREVRRTFPGSGDLAWRAQVADKFAAKGLDPSSLTGLLLKKSAENVFKKDTRK